MKHNKFQFTQDTSKISFNTQNRKEITNYNLIVANSYVQFNKPRHQIIKIHNFENQKRETHHNTINRI